MPTKSVEATPAKAATEVTPRTAAPTSPASSPAAARINWDDSRMSSSYANVCNVTNTREEVVLLFGINQTLQRGTGAEVTIELTERIFLSPHVAKSLAAVLGNAMRDYETRYGPLVGEAPAGARRT